MNVAKEIYQFDNQFFCGSENPTDGLQLLESRSSLRFPRVAAVGEGIKGKTSGVLFFSSIFKKDLIKVIY